MWWVFRGLSDGVVTTRWPKQSDEYFDRFAATVDVLSDATAIDGEAVTSVCPTSAIAVDDVGRISLDRGRCILCGRCVRAQPTMFGWHRGAATAHFNREALVATAVTETEEAVAAIREDIRQRTRRLRRSVHIRHIDVGSDGSDEWEVHALTNPVYDVHRLGIFFTASPRHADILLVTGVGTEGMSAPLSRTLTAMPNPTVIIAAGTDAISGGLMGHGYTDGTGAGNLVNVDVWVPGSPPSPFSLLYGILLSLDRLDEIGGGR